MYNQSTSASSNNLAFLDETVYDFITVFYVCGVEQCYGPLMSLRLQTTLPNRLYAISPLLCVLLLGFNRLFAVQIKVYLTPIQPEISVLVCERLVSMLSCISFFLV